MDNPVTGVSPFTLRQIRAWPKSDLHNHCLLGGRRSILERFHGNRLAPFRPATGGIEGLNRWIREVFRPVMEKPGAFEKGVEAAFLQARMDGVTVLEMSIDAYFGRMFGIPPERIISTLRQTHADLAPGIDFRPELGFARTLPMQVVMECFEDYAGSGYFRSIDLYDDEIVHPAGGFRELYRQARGLGMRCKAHAGEFGSASSVREAVEILELDAVQHGIGAADDPEVMSWLARNQVTLNVCPTSNIRLKRVRSYKTHPIRILFDHGVRVTVNTDDALVFGDGVSEQFLKLLRSGLFSPGELEIIRQNGVAGPAEVSV
jgi:adenosine deaminase